ncbi:MAG: methionyl-tRNA formyltransferase [Clostridia bacterium]|nr:methionyl-tRNA formyltransferase [Clostridia bacterium]
MRLTFMGTPDFAVPCLEALVQAGHEIIGVVTQPDRPKGRGKQLAPSPVKVKALELNLPLYQPEKIKTLEFTQKLREMAPEAIIVVAFGQLLSREILAIPPFGCINVHASLLPKLRGAAPIHWAVINGEEKTGITTMYMDVGMDTGDMILKKEVPITLEDTVGSIHDKLAGIGAKLLVETLEQIARGTAPRTTQEHTQATYAPLLQREHEQIRWEQPAHEVINLIRGMNPWPGAYTSYQGKILKVWAARPAGAVPVSGSFQPGQVVQVLPKEGLVVETGDGRVLISEIQLQGSRRMAVRDFLPGNPVAVGEFLG